ncbi:hypothetical protein IA69_03045 [Massilia sp. JS1662]|nr:hypothetical protein [Massilia sp. JS1662]KGF83202.1 hypothetical protein IA69_03045 [Massilia sp. JS1662]
MTRADTVVAGRRACLARGLAVGALALALPPPGRAAAPVPSTTVSLAEFGGRPGAGRAALAGAFRHALAALSRAGGGTLLVPPGAYDFGTVDAPVAIVPCRDLRDIAISAYGAVFIANTAAPVMPNMFYFFNFDNVTLAGATFMDQGFSPWIDWRGMYCVGIQADRPSGDLRLVDCRAERVLGLLASNNGPAARHLVSGIHVQGTVRHAYYGVGANHVAGRVSVDLACHNVRRAFIAYAARHADVAVRASADAAWPGSNGFVALVCAGARLGNVEDVRVRVDVAGPCIHGSYVHFYHQGPERDGVMRDVDATVNVAGMDTLACMFLFDHETHGVRPRTTRQWDRIGLHGSLPAGCAGRVVANPSVSAAPGTVWLDRSLARPAGVLPAGFRVVPRSSASVP